MDYLIATKPVDPQLKAILSRASKQGTEFALHLKRPIFWKKWWDVL